jgi:short-subunit dehydrogenase
MTNGKDMNKKIVVLVTGASSGMGKVTALRLVKEGYMVYGAARRSDEMLDLVDAGGFAISMDITNEEQIVSAVSEIIKQQGRIDILINNAGYGLYGAVEDVTLDDARRQFEVNLFGLARITKEVLPQMRERKSGTIINMSSMGGKIYTPLGAWYHASKHALEGWSDCLRLELKRFNIKVIIIEPGVIATAFGDVMSAPLMKISGEGAYKNLAQHMAKSTIDNYDKPNAATQPSAIADTILKAIKSENPKTRYSAGKLAKPLMLLRKWFGDKFFDWAVMKEVK